MLEKLKHLYLLKKKIHEINFTISACSNRFGAIAFTLCGKEKEFKSEITKYYIGNGYKVYEETNEYGIDNIYYVKFDEDRWFDKTVLGSKDLVELCF